MSPSFIVLSFNFLLIPVLFVCFLTSFAHSSFSTELFNLHVFVVGFQFYYIIVDRIHEIILALLYFLSLL